MTTPNAVPYDQVNEAFKSGAVLVQSDDQLERVDRAPRRYT